MPNSCFIKAKIERKGKNNRLAGKGNTELGVKKCITIHSGIKTMISSRRVSELSQESGSQSPFIRIRGGLKSRRWVEGSCAFRAYRAEVAWMGWVMEVVARWR